MPETCVKCGKLHWTQEELEAGASGEPRAEKRPKRKTLKMDYSTGGDDSQA